MLFLVPLSRFSILLFRLMTIRYGCRYGYDGVLCDVYQYGQSHVRRVASIPVIDGDRRMGMYLRGDGITSRFILTPKAKQACRQNCGLDGLTLTNFFKIIYIYLDLCGQSKKVSVVL